ncbi:anti-sigma factor [Bacillus sp. FJAT-18019]|nr:anti-sigma factor [Bacillus sp. FJAT-18019]
MHDKLNRMKEQYESTPIPDELSSIVNKTIATRRRKNRALPWIASVAAACALLFAGVNASPAFAKAMSDVPVLGEIVKVMTIREYAEQDDNTAVHIETPGITNLGNTELEQTLNNKYLEENKKLYENFKDEVAQLNQEGGGHLSLDSGYEVVTDNEQLLTLLRYVVESAGGSAESRQYDTIDKINHLVITLPSLFKDDSYIQVISDNIKEQMRQQMQDNPDNIYWVEQPGVEPEIPEDLFQTIDKDQNFYISPSGKLVISFNEYDVAPGYMGVVEFTIPTEVIQDLLVSNEYIR